MVAEVAGHGAAKGNADAKAATLRQIIRDALTGRNGREKIKNWLPGWMAFPFRAYAGGTSRLGAVTAQLEALERPA
jgi:ParB family chromosome partitioning protein